MVLRSLQPVLFWGAPPDAFLGGTTQCVGSMSVFGPFFYRTVKVYQFGFRYLITDELDPSDVEMLFLRPGLKSWGASTLDQDRDL